ncbi:undecaprenyl-diphosphate phosphatase [Candidatus Saccharibacteria bacterium]|nr:undecaprenyl-diphosphate phosphatase [Candidatus Saccharibacteria bacterium]
MSYLDAIILGLVQGLTEFIPVSSSGHLVIFNYLLGTPESFAFDVLLNIGTLSALILFYRKRIKELIIRTFVGKEWALLSKLLAATIPAFAIGLLFGNQIKALNNMVWVVVIMLVLVGILMIIYGKPNPESDDSPLESSVTWPVALRVGFAQAIALIPGTSRSGITILTGLRSNLSAARAAEFSFMLAIPTIAGATTKVMLLDGGWSYVTSNVGVVLVGNIVSFASGLFAIGFLLKLLSTRGLRDFGWYRIGLAAVLSVLLVTGII